MLRKAACLLAGVTVVQFTLIPKPALEREYRTEERGTCLSRCVDSLGVLPASFTALVYFLGFPSEAMREHRQ